MRFRDGGAASDCDASALRKGLNVDRNTGIALGLSSLVLGGIAATHRAPPTTTPSGRPVPPSTARRAFAARDGVPVRAGPAANTPEVARLGRGSAVRVAGEEDLPGSGFLPIVREWVEENGSRFSRTLGYVAAVDVVFTDPSPFRTLGPARTPIAEEGQPTGDRSDGGECDVFFTATWPSAVTHFKERLDTVFQATNASIERCAGLDAAEREQWNVFFTTWRTFRNTPTPTIGSGAHWDQTCAFSRTLDGWRAKLRQTRCALVGPVGIHGYELPSSTGKAIENVATIVKWGALTIGGAVLIGTFYPEIRAGLTVLRARRK